MTTEHLNNLADALENIAHMEYPSAHHDGNNLREAARILRAAASVDVAGLMRRIDEHGARRWDTGCAESAFDKLGAKRYDNDAQEVRAALESALRMALAAREGFVLVPVEPTPEMVDAARSLTSWPDGVYRAMLAAAPKGTP